ncbi:alpha/beta hydrolase [Moraxella nasovis]|uniref:alpha/beta hydrolase n=1 Tax=Moraxella nasovis TaxID=2904121 RepID=UPI001F61B883|nr:alpha/beta hydrolase [Moraxella nasovis]UNU72549.1 alpha/beta hydrolase [Moraxella nasovis]
MKKFVHASIKVLLFIIAITLIIIALGYGRMLLSETTQGDVAWRSCYRPTYWSWFSIPPSPQLQCANIDVPLNDTSNQTITLALTRLPSTHEHAKELLLINGGPGGHSLDMADWLSDDEYTQALKDNFHILGIAQRGVRPSTAMNCGNLTEEEGAKAYVDACIKHSGLDFIKSIDTLSAVKDLDFIRHKLNIDTWSMLGYSYGTKVVALYAQAYPKRLRAGVLDAVVDTKEDLFTMWANQQSQAQFAFDRFIVHCQQDERCIFAKSDDQNRKFLTTLHELSAQKFTDKNNDAINERTLLALFEDNLGEPMMWRELNEMFDELKQGKTDKYNELLFIKEFGEKDFTQDAFIAINCADSAPKVRQDYLDKSRHVDKIATYNDIKQTTDELLDACYYWPFDGTDDLTMQAVADVPTLLFVAQKHDLATPFHNAKNMAARFRGHLIYTPNFGHTISLSAMNACIDQAVVDYLVALKKPDRMMCE